MSEHTPKIELKPTSPEETLEMMMPWSTDSYGSPLRRNKGYQLQRSDTVHLDRYARDPNIVKRTSTMWTLHEMSDDYTRKLIQTLGHFHRTGANITGFCPNEDLPFGAVNTLIELLNPLRPAPEPIKPRRVRQPASA